MTILEALKAVANHDTDRAREHNTVGFSGLDTNFANKLAEQDSLSPKQEVYAARFVRKYRNQVFAYLCPEAKDYPKSGKTHDQAVANFLSTLTWQHPTFDFTKVAPTAKPKSRGKVSAVVGNKNNELKGFVVRFPYDAELVSAVKNLPNRKFKNDPADKRWEVGCSTTDIFALASLVVRYNLDASNATRTFLGLEANNG